MLKVQSCKLYDNKYMIPLTQITNTEVFAFIAVLVLGFVYKQERQKELPKSRLLLKKIANFTGK